MGSELESVEKVQTRMRTGNCFVDGRYYMGFFGVVFFRNFFVSVETFFPSRLFVSFNVFSMGGGLMGVLVWTVVL